MKFSEFKAWYEGFKKGKEGKDFTKEDIELIEQQMNKVVPDIDHYNPYNPYYPWLSGNNMLISYSSSTKIDEYERKPNEFLYPFL